MLPVYMAPMRIVYTIIMLIYTDTAVCAPRARGRGDCETLAPGSVHALPVDRIFRCRYSELAAGRGVYRKIVGVQWHHRAGL